MNSTTSFLSYKPEISQELDLLFSQALTAFPHPWAERFFNDSLEYAKRGRMIRGSVVIHTWLACTDESTEQIPPAVLRTAACIEIFESALLMHDDIIDRDLLRRGKPSMHAALTTASKQLAASNTPHATLTDPEHLGESLAVLLGDILFFIIYQELSSLPVSDSQRLQLIQIFSRLAITTGLGQTMDVAAGFQLSSLSQSEILRMYQDKTGSYSFCLPLQFGAVLSNQPATVAEQLQAIGVVLGQLYQLADDHKGIFAESEETGKPAGGDIREGKQTLHRLFALKTLTGRAAERFAKLYGNPNLTADELTEVRALFAQQQVLSSITVAQHSLEEELSQLLNASTASKKLRAMLEKIWGVVVTPLKNY
jgi:geranylgeranyl diphosphate synthase type I